MILKKKIKIFLQNFKLKIVKFKFKNVFRSIAAELKAGKTIIPRNYDSATVGFCQIVDFVVLLAKCTPAQVNNCLPLMVDIFFVAKILKIFSKIYI